MYSMILFHRYCTMMKFFLCLSLFTPFVLLGQVSLDSALTKMQETKLLPPPEDSIHQLMINGQLISALVSDGDTLYFADIGNINISSPRSFESKADYLRYLKYRRYAAKVYPFAKEAMRIFKEAEYASATMKKRKRKKYLKKLAKELEKEFEEPSKRLSKTQGKIMVKMIERELNVPMFDLIKMTQGKFKAFYWNQSSKLYGYRLKTGYVMGQNSILDIVLQDFDISHEIAEYQK